MAEQIHREHRDRHQKWQRLARPDHGIDLKRLPARFVLRDAGPPKPVDPEKLALARAIATAATSIVVPDPEHKPNVSRHPRKRWPRSTPFVVKQIIKRVAEANNVGVGQIMSASRVAKIIVPRHAAMYLAKIITGRSLPWLGRQFGGRDHTTVLHAINKTKRRALSDFQFASHLAALECAIRRDCP